MALNFLVVVYMHIYVVRHSFSSMTTSSRILKGAVAMRPEMADEANPSAEASATCGAEVREGSIGGAGCSGLSHLTLLFCGLSSTFLG